MKKSFLFVLILLPLFCLPQLTPKSIVTTNGNIGFYEFKPSGYDQDSSYKYPLIIFLHGVGERGNGTTELPMALLASFPKLLVANATMQFVVNGRKHAFVVLIPQMSKQYTNWQNFYVDEMIVYAKQHLKIDENKIFLTGWSLGGGGVWKYPTSSIEKATAIAGIIPVSPAPDYTNLCNIARGKVAVWAHHALDDASVPIHFTKDAIKGIKICSPIIPPLMTYYSSGGHPFVANQAYDTLNKTQYPNMYQWMIGTSRSNDSATNQYPFANAGKDTTVVIPFVTSVLNGQLSYDPNDVIVKYEWTVISGPRSPGLLFDKPDFPISTVSGLEQGDYIFRLSVTDQFGVSSSDEVKVSVILPPDGENAIPLVDAGPEIKVYGDTYYVHGNARDFDGTIQSRTWRQISGPCKLVIKNYYNVAHVMGMYIPGTYLLEFSASDNGKPVKNAADTLVITRKAVLPFNIFYWSDHPKVSPPEKRDVPMSVFGSYVQSKYVKPDQSYVFTLLLLLLLGYVLLTYYTRPHNTHCYCHLCRGLRDLAST